MAYYLDSSALAKLVVEEAESAPLRAWLEAEGRDAVSCDLARTELMRAVRRIGGDNRPARVRELLASITVLDLATLTFEAAGRLDPPGLRSLDAIHLASALELGDDLQGLVTYDLRLAAAARANGVPVVSIT